ncbi:sigma-70 family RNA polymerase sigma factor [bacterium]|nr:sigma-70 family RNA polymerase sigma factor [bacterium]
MKDTEAKIENLLIQYKSCSDERKRKILHIKIIELALMYVKKIVSMPIYHFYGLQEDLFQVGSIGLLKAIDFFDVAKQTKFKTYAMYFIKGEIRHYLRDKVNFIRAPREIQEISFRITQAAKELEKDGLDGTSVQLLSEKLGMPENRVEAVLQLMKEKDILSLDQASSDDDEDLSLLDKIPDGDYKDFLSNSENRLMLNSAIQELPADLKEVLVLNYYNDLTQKEIAEKTGLSVMQVSRKIKKALNTLYKAVRGSEK